MHPKSFVSNFWGAVHTDIASLFTFLPFTFLLFLEQHSACPLVSLAPAGVVSVRNFRTVLHDIPWLILLQI